MTGRRTHRTGHIARPIESSPPDCLPFGRLLPFYSKLMHYSLGLDMQPTRDLNIVRTVELTSPQDLLAELPCSEAANQTVVSGRTAICRLLRGEDPRMLAVVGPCSIHDEQGAMEYAERLNELSRQVADRIVLVMRVYFEKPRTTLGWKGLIMIRI